MKYLSLLLLATLFLSSGCGNDDDVPIITIIGRQDGWSVTDVESDFAAQANAAITAATDEELANDTRTRADIQAQFDLLVAQETAVDDCDRDDALLFRSDGLMQLFRGDVICPGTGDPHVLDGLKNFFYSTDIDGTRMRIRNLDNETVTTYDILELSEDAFRFKNNRVVEDSTVGPVLYELTYSLRAR
ncbi:MAG: hypothetical protein AAFN92_20230 [Bacteroidota bacterium]